MRELLWKESVAMLNSWRDNDTIEGVSCQDIESALSSYQPEKYWKDTLYKLTMNIVPTDAQKITDYLASNTLIASLHQDYISEHQVQYHADFYIKREMHEKMPNHYAPATVMLSDILSNLGLVTYWNCGITVKLLKLSGGENQLPPPG